VTSILTNDAIAVSNGTNSIAITPLLEICFSAWPIPKSVEATHLKSETRRVPSDGYVILRRGSNRSGFGGKEGVEAAWTGAGFLELRVAQPAVVVEVDGAINVAGLYQQAEG
jgi:hypothetical protein